jgi:hypothetical protein
MTKTKHNLNTIHFWWNRRRKWSDQKQVAALMSAVWVGCLTVIVRFGAAWSSQARSYHWVKTSKPSEDNLIVLSWSDIIYIQEIWISLRPRIFVSAECLPPYKQVEMQSLDVSFMPLFKTCSCQAMRTYEENVGPFMRLGRCSRNLMREQHTLKLLLVLMSLLWLVTPCGP